MLNCNTARRGLLLLCRHVLRRQGNQRSAPPPALDGKDDIPLRIRPPHPWQAKMLDSVSRKPNRIESESLHYARPVHEPQRMLPSGLPKTQFWSWLGTLSVRNQDSMRMHTVTTHLALQTQVWRQSAGKPSSPSPRCTPVSHAIPFLDQHSFAPASCADTSHLTEVGENIVQVTS